MCKVDGCSRPVAARGLCKVCHQRQRRAARRAETPRQLKPIFIDDPREDMEVVFAIRLSEPDRARLDCIARERGLTCAALIRLWIKEARSA